jgi:hypothetical protein
MAAPRAPPPPGFYTAGARRRKAVTRVAASARLETARAVAVASQGGRACALGPVPNRGRRRRRPLQRAPPAQLIPRQAKHPFKGMKVRAPRTADAR